MGDRHCTCTRAKQQSKNGGVWSGGLWQSCRDEACSCHHGNSQQQWWRLEAAPILFMYNLTTEVTPLSISPAANLWLYFGLPPIAPHINFPHSNRTRCVARSQSNFTVYGRRPTWDPSMRNSQSKAALDHHGKSQFSAPHTRRLSSPHLSSPRDSIASWITYATNNPTWDVCPRTNWSYHARSIREQRDRGFFLLNATHRLDYCGVASRTAVLRQKFSRQWTTLSYILVGV